MRFCFVTWTRAVVSRIHCRRASHGLSVANQAATRREEIESEHVEPCVAES
jgi:hypothetical protein